MHGDDLDPASAADVYAPAVATGWLRLVPRGSDISTTELIARVRRRLG